MISKHVTIGKNVEIGNYEVIEAGVEIGDGTVIRYDSIIARGCNIGDGTYVCPRVMTNNLDSGKDQIGGAHIGKNCFIGTNSVLHHGITIGDNSITGSLAFVNKNIPANEIWIGSPAKFYKIIGG